MSAGSRKNLTTTRDRRLLHVFGCVVTGGIIAAGTMLALGSTDSQAAALRNAVALHSATAESAEEAAVSLELAECEASFLRTRYSELLAMIPDSPEESVFLGELARLAGETDFQLSDFRPGTVEPDENVNMIRVRVTAMSDYEALCRFLYGLPRLRRLTHVVSMKIEQSPDPERYQVELNLAIYFARNNAVELSRVSTVRAEELSPNA